MSKENSVIQQKDVMAALKSRKKGKKRIILIVVIAVIVLLFVYIKGAMEEAVATVQDTLTQMQTDEVSKRSLIKSIGATGTVVSIQSKDVKADLAGAEISDILVEIGDSVSAGQELVIFNTEDIEESLASAKEQLELAEKRNALSAADAKRSVENAQRSEAYQIDAAKTSMDNAYDNYEIAMVDYNNESKKLENLKKNEADIYDSYIRVKENLKNLERLIPEKEAQVQAAAAELETLESVSSGDVANYETALSTYQSLAAELESLQAQQAENNGKLLPLESRYNQAKNERIAQENIVNPLEEKYDAMTDNYNASVKSYNNTVASQASSVASAKSSQQSVSLSASTSSQEKQVQQYEEQLQKGVLTAPIDGIVTAVNYEKGDAYAQGAVVTIQDCSAFEIEAQIDEYDISDIKVGQRVFIKTDATRDEELEGTVIFVSPVASNSGMGASSVTYKIRISVDTPNDRLRLDMSASLSIIIEEHENVYTVPYNAVQEGEDGNTFIELIGEDGFTTTKLPIRIVMESNYYTEISADGLEEGMKIKVIEDEEDMIMELMMGGF